MPLQDAERADDSPATEIRPEEIETLPRYREIAKLDAYYRQKQYEGLPNWWTGDAGNGKTVPLRERAPCVNYPLPKALVNQAVRFTFGEGRFPTIKAEEVDKDHAVAPGATLSAAEADDLGRFVAEVVERAELRWVMKALLRHGLRSKTAVAIGCVRDGTFAVDIPQAQDCWPTFKSPGSRQVKQLTWCYRFNKLVREQSKLVEKPHYFRRDVTEQAYVEYEDAPIEIGQTQPIEWKVAKEGEKEHGFGFCPVVWIPNRIDAQHTDIDGTGLYEGMLPEVDALNFALSQRHRGIAFWGVPQPFETGVEEDDAPGATGRAGGAAATGRGMAIPQIQDDKVVGYFRPGDNSMAAVAARKVSVDEIWKYTSPQARPGLLETSGASFDAATKHVTDIRGRIVETSDAVLVDPSEMAGKGELSGAALERIFAPLLAMVSEIRECWWPHGLHAILQMFLRMLVAKGGEGIFIPLAIKVAKILARFNVQTEGGEIFWVAPRFTPKWGRPFTPSPNDVNLMVTATKTAKDGKMICRETAARTVAPFFGVDDPARELEEVEKEAEEAAKAFQEGQVPGAPQTPESPAGEAAKQNAIADETKTDVAAAKAAAKKDEES